MKDLRQQLEHCFGGRTCIIGLGNADYGDDSLGVRLAEELIGAGVPDLIIAGTEPERCVGRVANEGFDRVLFLDAMDFGGAPGSVALLDAAEIANRYPQISTHKISLGLFAKWIEAGGRTKVSLLGVQPESMQGGACLSATAQTTLELLRDLLLEARSKIAGRSRTGEPDSRPQDRALADVTV